MTMFDEANNSQSRRNFLFNSGMGLSAALASSLFPQHLHAAQLEKQLPHFAPKAKRVIFLFMAGAPSQLDLFDYKPDLHKLFKTPLPPSVSKKSARYRNEQKLSTADCPFKIQI